MFKRIVCAVAVCVSLQVNASAETECFPIVEVVKVVDGDTIDVRIHVRPTDLDILAELRIRMAGINAWESRTRNAAEKEKGLAAKARLQELAEVPMTVCLSGKGKFGRWIGVLYDGDRNINEQLVIEGHAHRYDGLVQRRCGRHSSRGRGRGLGKTVFGSGRRPDCGWHRAHLWFGCGQISSG